MMIRILAVLIAATLPQAAMAEVVQSTPDGFATKASVLVAASPEAAWQALVAPAEWWDRAHTYSGDSANLSIEAKAGGCFCEKVPGGKAALSSDGAVEHMRVIYLAPGKALRMQGGLGPLQSEAVTGVLTVTLKPETDGTRIVWEYVVGGFMRQPLAGFAQPVDGVLTQQLERLAGRLGRR